MNEVEFLADLQTKVLWMGTPVEFGRDGLTVDKKVPVVQMGHKGTAKPAAQFQYVVLNEGVTDAEDPMFNETVYAVNPVELPVNDALNAVAYLEAQKAAGVFSAYDYESGRSDLGYFFAKVWEDNGDGTESEHKIRVSYDANGNPSHVKVI